MYSSLHGCACVLMARFIWVFYASLVPSSLIVICHISLGRRVISGTLWKRISLCVIVCTYGNSCVRSGWCKLGKLSSWKGAQTPQSLYCTPKLFFILQPPYSVCVSILFYPLFSTSFLHLFPPIPPRVLQSIVITVARGLRGFQPNSPFFSDPAWTQHSTCLPFFWGFDPRVHDCNRMSRWISYPSNRRHQRFRRFWRITCH
jgi:hypothetical protein